MSAPPSPPPSSPASALGLDHAKLILCVGPGGVGKTTTSAAIALAAARAGRATLVLTIDPARRLADALGLDGLDDEARRVAVPDLPPGGRLDAAMLDTRASYDALITRITRSEEERASILNNRAYRAFSRSLARSHAYVAMERLHYVLEAGGYDLVVLDTPPTRSALDILDAPGRLVRFLDERVIRWFVSATPGAAVRLGTPVARALKALVGESILSELVAFFSVLAHLRDGFRARASAMEARIRDASTAFVLVASPSVQSLGDAAFLRDDLAKRGVGLDVVIFNQAFIPEPYSPSEPVHPVSDDPHPSPSVRAVRQAFVEENASRRAAIDAFVAAGGGAAPVVLLTAEAERDIRDLDGLRRLLADSHRARGVDDAKTLC